MEENKSVYFYEQTTKKARKAMERLADGVSSFGPPPSKDTRRKAKCLAEHFKEMAS
jgi:hypothetical protein